MIILLTRQLRWTTGMITILCGGMLFWVFHEESMIRIAYKPQRITGSSISISSIVNQSTPVLQNPSSPSSSSLFITNNNNNNNNTTTLDIQFALFYLPLENNRKNSLNHYKSGLAQTCSYILGSGYRGIALGDLNYIGSIPNCENLSKPEHNYNRVYTWKDLRLRYAASLPLNHSCDKKFYTAGMGGKETVLSVDMLQIWLNKVDILCDLAEQEPDYITFLIDAALHPMYYHVINRTILYRQENPTSQLLSVRKYTTFGERTWFNSEQCTEPVNASAAVMAIRGRDCKPVRHQYHETLSRIANETIKAAETGEGCACFDEEVILTQMLKADMPLLHMIPTVP